MECLYGHSQQLDRLEQASILFMTRVRGWKMSKSLMMTIKRQHKRKYRYWERGSTGGEVVP